MNEWEFKASLVDAVSRLLTAALWPTLVLVLVAGFSYPLWRLLARLSDLEEAEVAGQKVKFRKGVESANEVIDDAEENGSTVAPAPAGPGPNVRPSGECQPEENGERVEQSRQPGAPTPAGNREQTDQREQVDEGERAEGQEKAGPHQESEEFGEAEQRERDFVRLKRALRGSRSDYEDWLVRGPDLGNVSSPPLTRREQRENGFNSWLLPTRRAQKESRSSDAAFLILDAWAELERGVLRQSGLLGFSFSRVSEAISAMRPDLAEALTALRETRNLVAHAEYSPTFSDAQAYGLATRRFLQRLEPIELDVEPDDDESGLDRTSRD